MYKRLQPELIELSLHTMTTQSKPLNLPDVVFHLSMGTILDTELPFIYDERLAFSAITMATFEKIKGRESLKELPILEPTLTLPNGKAVNVVKKVILPIKFTKMVKDDKFTVERPYLIVDNMNEYEHENILVFYGTIGRDFMEADERFQVPSREELMERS